MGDRTSARTRAGARPARALSLLAGTRRQFNLPRWADRDEVRDLRDSAVAWIDRHFELIEEGAPWLHPVGRQVRDSCSGQVSGPTLAFTPRFKAVVGCVRNVTVVYGFDGSLANRVRSLGQAIPLGGWELPGREAWQDFDEEGAGSAAGARAQFRTQWMTSRQATLTWHPTAAVGLPAGADQMRPRAGPPLAPSMRVTWSSRGQQIRDRDDPNLPRGATRNFLPLEISPGGVRELLEQGIAGYGHVLRVTIELSWFSNPDARRRPGRVPRYILPTPPTPYRRACLSPGGPARPPRRAASGRLASVGEVRSGRTHRPGHCMLNPLRS